MNTIKHYLSVYRKFIETSFAEAASFRLNFVLLILMDIVFYISALATVSFIYDHVSMIGPWNKAQLMFFVSFMLAVDHLHMVILSESFWMLSTDIRTGNLDYTLLKPVHSIFIIFFRYFRASSTLNIFVTWATLIYFGLQANLTMLSWISLPFLVILAFILLAILEIMISTSMFWLTEGLGINFLRMQMQQVSRWPDYIYQRTIKKVFTIAFPILLIGSAPVRFLYDNQLFENIFLLIGAIVIFYFLLLKLWDIALRRYDSASS